MQLILTNQFFSYAAFIACILSLLCLVAMILSFIYVRKIYRAATGMVAEILRIETELPKKLGVKVGDLSELSLKKMVQALNENRLEFNQIGERLQTAFRSSSSADMENKLFELGNAVRGIETVNNETKDIKAKLAKIEKSVSGLNARYEELLYLENAVRDLIGPEKMAKLVGKRLITPPEKEKTAAISATNEVKDFIDNF